MWKALLAVGVLALVVLLAMRIDRPAPPADVVFINRGDVTTMDLQRMSWMQDLRVAAAIYEGLVVNDVFSRDFVKTPGVAKTWEISPDGRTYTFHLRDDARWSNGDPVTAQDFIYSWRRALLPDLAGDYVALFQLIDGAKEFWTWRDAELTKFMRESQGQARPDEAQALYTRTLEHFAKTVGLSAPDEHTFVVRLARPTPYFLDLCAFEVFAPVHGPTVEKHQHPSPVTGRLEFDQAWTKPPYLVSNGPFVLASWRYKRDMRLERNPFYWNRAHVNVDSILIPTVNDSNAAVLSVQTGGVDWLSDVVPDYRADLLEQKRAYLARFKDQVDALRARGLDQVAIDRQLPADPALNIYSFPAFGTYWYNFNCLPSLPDGRKNPFHDPRVRKAFALCIDKQNLVDNIKRAGELVANTIIPRGSIGGYASPRGLPCAPDPAAIALARQLLEDAGYPGGKGLPQIEILVSTNGGHEKPAQAVKNDWERYLGVSVRIDQKDVNVFADELKRQNYMVSRAGWFGDYGDPTTFLDLSRKDDGNNDRKYGVSPHPLDHYAQFESLLNQAQNEADPAKRLAMLSEAERILVEEDVPLVPVHHYCLVMMFDAHKISGPSPHPRQKQHIFLLDRLDDDKGSNVPLEIPPAGQRNEGRNGRRRRGGPSAKAHRGGRGRSASNLTAPARHAGTPTRASSSRRFRPFVDTRSTPWAR